MMPMNPKVKQTITKAKTDPMSLTFNILERLALKGFIGRRFWFSSSSSEKLRPLTSAATVRLNPAFQSNSTVSLLDLVENAAVVKVGFLGLFPATKDFRDRE